MTVRAASVGFELIGTKRLTGGTGGNVLCSQVGAELVRGSTVGVRASQIGREVAYTVGQSPHPLLDTFGVSVIHPAWPVPRVPWHGVIASEGPARNVRVSHERKGRRYRVPVNMARKSEYDALVRALDESKGGVLRLKWRHPVDDPPAPAAGPGVDVYANAPWYFINNAREGRLAVQRSPEGAVVNFELELEEA